MRGHVVASLQKKNLTVSIVRGFLGPCPEEEAEKKERIMQEVLAEQDLGNKQFSKGCCIFDMIFRSVGLLCLWLSMFTIRLRCQSV